jgi:hypothetical protein
LFALQVSNKSQFLEVEKVSLKQSTSLNLLLVTLLGLNKE